MNLAERIRFISQRVDGEASRGTQLVEHRLGVPLDFTVPTSMLNTGHLSLDVFTPEFRENHLIYLVYANENLEKQEDIAVFDGLVFSECSKLNSQNLQFVEEKIDLEFVLPVYESFSREKKEELKAIHQVAKEQLLLQEFSVCTLNGKVVAFLSLKLTSILGIPDSTVSTHWVDRNIESSKRAAIHRKYFSIVSDFNKKIAFGSIFIENSRSIGLFAKNDYFLAGAQVFPL